MFIFGVIFALIAGVLFGLIGPTTKLAYNSDAAVALVIFMRYAIASIIIFPEVNNLNPNSVIYLIGSLWGGSQIVVLFISIIILIKYKSLLSLAWLVFVFDNILRIITMTMHNLDQDYLTSTAPGGLVGTSVMLFVTLLMFFISTIERKQK